MPHGRAPLKLTTNTFPAFTLDDVREFLLSAPRSAGGPTVSGQLPTIETLEFVRCKELSDRLRLSIGLADDALVCYVVLRGPFQLTGMSFPPGVFRGIPIAQTVQEFYDANTGRMLMWGSGLSRTGSH